MEFDTGIDSRRDVSPAVVSTGREIPLDNFSISFSTSGTCSGHMVSQDERVAIRCSGSNIFVALGDDAGLPEVSTRGNPLRGSVWNFVTVTKNGNNVRIYANGLMRANATRRVVSSERCSALFLNGADTSTGCNRRLTVEENNEDTFGSSVVLDDVRVFHIALGASDVMALYLERGFTPW